MKDRIAQIMQKEEMTAGQFAEKIGISPSSLSHILSGRNNPSLEVVTKIHKACNYVNLFWLLYGDGEMEGPAQTVTSENSPISGISLFDESAFFASEGTDERENRKEIASKSPVFTPKEIVREEIKYIDPDWAGFCRGRRSRSRCGRSFQPRAQRPWPAPRRTGQG